MIGNDLVDLNIAFEYPKSNNLKYLQKICTDNEIELILNSEFPELLLWRMWTMKESGYKIISKKTGINAFIPKKITTEITNPIKGFIHSIWGKFISHTESSNNYIHTVAADNPENFQYQICQCTEKDKSLAVRIALRDKLQELFAHRLSSLNINIQNVGHVPKLFVEEHPLPCDISFTHHGNWVAWAFQAENSNLY